MILTGKHAGLPALAGSASGPLGPRLRRLAEALRLICDDGPVEQQRLPSRLSPPIAFGHRGARAHARENTLEAFSLALEMGATGVESDVWLTADQVAVLDHDGVFGRFFWRRRIGRFKQADLPSHVPSLVDLYDRCGVGYQLSLDVKDVAAIDAVVAAATDAGAAEKLWAVHPDVDLLEEWRQRWPDLRLVCSTRVNRMSDSPERFAARLAEVNVEAINLPAKQWTGGLTTLFHRFDRLCFAWGAEYERVLTDLVRMGIDAIYSDHVDRLVAALKP